MGLSGLDPEEVCVIDVSTGNAVIYAESRADDTVGAPLLQTSVKASVSKAEVQADPGDTIVAAAVKDFFDDLDDPGTMLDAMDSAENGDGGTAEFKKQLTKMLKEDL